jgi:hypothetical protein
MSRYDTPVRPIINQKMSDLFDSLNAERKRNTDPGLRLEPDERMRTLHVNGGDGVAKSSNHEAKVGEAAYWDVLDRPSWLWFGRAKLSLGEPRTARQKDKYIDGPRNNSSKWCGFRCFFRRFLPVKHCSLKMGTLRRITRHMG